MKKLKILTRATSTTDINDLDFDDDYTLELRRESIEQKLSKQFS